MDQLAQRQERRDRLAKALDASRAQIAEGFRQLMEASEREDAREQVKMRARHIIEEARLNYDQTVQALLRLEDDERNDRLEAIAKSSMRAMWATALVAVAALVLALVPLLK